MQFAGHFPDDLSLLKCMILSGTSDKTEVVYEDIEEPGQGQRAKKDQDIELETCPAYGEKRLMN